METSVGVGLNLKTVHLSTFGGDQDSPLSTLGAIEYDSLSTLEEGNLLDFRRQNVI